MAIRTDLPGSPGADCAPPGEHRPLVVLAGIATHKVSRLLAKDTVTSFGRAPFTRYRLAQWVVGGFALGYVLAPRVTAYSAAEQRQ
jgi:hypothetical protein